MGFVSTFIARIPLPPPAVQTRRVTCASECPLIGCFQSDGHARNRIPPHTHTHQAATSLDIDISFNMTGGPEEARRIKEYMKLYPALRPLTLVVKQLLAQRCLNEVYTGGVGSYAILLMIMSFLQVIGDWMGG